MPGRRAPSWHRHSTPTGPSPSSTGRRRRTCRWLRPRVTAGSMPACACRVVGHAGARRRRQAAVPALPGAGAATARRRRRRPPRAAADDALAGRRSGLRCLLAARGALENTFIVFASDNGWHHVRHKLPPWKGTAFEKDIRIPLVVRGPGIRAGRTVHRLVANADGLTFAAWAGATAPAVDGPPLTAPRSGGPAQRAVAAAPAAGAAAGGGRGPGDRLAALSATLGPAGSLWLPPTSRPGGRKGSTRS